MEYLTVAKVDKQIKIFQVLLNDKNKYLIKYNQIHQKNKLINRLKAYKRKGLIKSIKKPRSRNYKFNRKLKEMIIANRVLTEAINKL